jgi:hypothetical protein
MIFLSSFAAALLFLPFFLCCALSSTLLFLPLFAIPVFLCSASPSSALLCGLWSSCPSVLMPLLSLLYVSYAPPLCFLSFGFTS